MNDTRGEDGVAAAAETHSSVISKDIQVEHDDDSLNTTTTAAAATTTTEYQLRTIRPSSISSRRRIKLLPAYPQAHGNRSVLLLFSNVAHVNRDAYEKQSFCGGNGVCPFEFRQYGHIESIDSFMIDLYRDLFIEPSRRWKIDHSIIDYNLSRLRQCMDLYKEQNSEPALSSLNELTLALEFYLQIDVDMFFMKTCDFRGSQPRVFSKEDDSRKDGDRIRETEGILCQAPPKPNCGMTFCFQTDCFLCTSAAVTRGRHRRLPSVTRQTAAQSDTESSTIDNFVGVEFGSTQIHRFVNKYEAILNCHANCLTSNIIYALTCPCDEYDYIGSTSASFHDRILQHRNESNRVIREFLIGPNNIEYMLKHATRLAPTVANNNMFLYQHSPRCSLVLQRFLEKNPDYWCFVPMCWQDAKAENEAYVSASKSSLSAVNAALYTAVRQIHQQQQPPESPAFSTKPRFFEAVLAGEHNFRSREECEWLTKGIPKPPSSHLFSRRQIDEQMDFFKFKKETHIRSSNLIDCHKYTIIAVLPDDCSGELRRFIETLFITHAETKMNTTGRLIHKSTGAFFATTTTTTTATSFDHSNRGLWCEKLVRERCSS